MRELIIVVHVDRLVLFVHDPNAPEEYRKFRAWEMTSMSFDRAWFWVSEIISKANRASFRVRVRAV